MGQKAKELKDSLDQKLVVMHQRTEQVQEKLKASLEESKAAVQSKIDKAKATFAKTQEKANKMKAELRTKFEAYKEEQEEEGAVARAEDAEAYAAWSMVDAMDAIGEAEYASLLAVDARMRADEIMAGH
jgi:hypothetical protein